MYKDEEEVIHTVIPCHEALAEGTGLDLSLTKGLGDRAPNTCHWFKTLLP